MNIQNDNGNDVFTYRRLRRLIGYLGVSLPVVLIVLSLLHFSQTRLQRSISDYYFTNLREIFTGTLFGVGLFLIRYKGLGNKQWWKNDNLLTNICGAMAFGVAFIPTNPEHGREIVYTLFPNGYPLLRALHYVFAAILLLSFSILSTQVFTLGQNHDESIPVSAMNENNIYRFCGYSILLFIILVPIMQYYKVHYATLVLESLSLFAFGFAWLVKGRALGDTGITGMKLYRERNLKLKRNITHE